MSLRNWFPRIYFWYIYFSRRRKKTFTAGDESLKINIYQTKSLTDAHGRNPETTVVNYITEIFDRLDIGYNISRNLDTYSPPEEESNPSNEVLRWWENQNQPSPAEDANLLMMNINGGGRAFIGGNFALAPAGNISGIAEFSEEGESHLHRNTRACLHELGHSLGLRHSDNYQEGKPSMLYSQSGIEGIREYIEQKQ